MSWPGCYFNSVWRMIASVRKRRLGPAVLVQQAAVREFVGHGVAKLAPNDSLHRRLRQDQRHVAGDPGLLTLRRPTSRRQRTRRPRERIVARRRWARLSPRKAAGPTRSSSPIDG